MAILGQQHRWHIKKPQYGSRRLAAKNHLVAALGEYVGTTLFMLFALGATNIANIPNTSITGSTTAGQAGTAAQTANTSNHIAFAFGISLTVTAWCFFRVSGGLFNPSITLGMLLVGALSPVRAVILAVVQFLGAITGAAILDALTPGTLNVRTQLTAGMSIARGLFLEAAMTALLMLSILLLAAEKSRGTFMAPLPIGLSLFVAELASVYYTGGSLNPARTLGPDVVLHTFDGYCYIYYIGPILGSTVAALFYRLIKYLEYETVQANEDEGATVMALKEHDPKTETGEEPVQPGKGTAVEVTGFAGGLLRSQDGKVAVMPQPGPLADPRDLSAKMDRLEELMSSVLAHVQGGRAVGRATSHDRLSGDTIAYPPIAKVMSEKTDSTDLSASPRNTADTLGDHPAWTCRSTCERHSGDSPV
ncbi:hypothetical protein JCM10908_005337 [Rhodotorula pacifica]|uniref:uncharacterized protein n=1 Tax=Rhodotorula pacifica TaxID=1495444 RepID=UPI00317FF145